MRTFQQIMEDAGYECTAYSGRGMGSEECLSISLKDSAMGKFFADVVLAMLPEERLLCAGSFRTLRTDSFGKGVVVYFPGIKFEE